MHKKIPWIALECGLLTPKMYMYGMYACMHACMHACMSGIIDLIHFCGAKKPYGSAAFDRQNDGNPGSEGGGASSYK